MHNIIDSEFNPISLRAALIAAASGMCVLAMGFAPIPQLWYFLAAGAVIAVITLATGPKFTNISVEVPTVFLILIPALLAIVFRNTSLIWAVVPMLAFVVAAATWMLITNRYAETAAEVSVQPAVTHQVPGDELAPKRQEKTAAANDESSATAA